MGPGHARSIDGGVYRFEPRTWKFDIYVPMNFPNPHGHVFDHWGRDIVFDATGGQPYLRAVVLDEEVLPGDGDEQGAEAGQTCGRGRSAAPEILSSRHFPEAMQGNLIVLNAIGFRGLLNYKLSEDGAGLKFAEVDPILQSADENFRPVDAEVGPDGALYFADWHNPIIGHMQHNLRDTTRDQLHGRVYRVTYPGRPLLTPAQIVGEPIPQLLELLKEPEDRVRYRAKIELSARDTNDVMAALQTWTDKPRSQGSAVRAPHDGSALGPPVAQPRQREAAGADAEIDRAVGARRGDARALLLARSRRRTRWPC